MGRKSTVESTLPAELLFELNSKLRDGKTKQLDVVDWLKDKGFNLSKSAVNRYAMRLAARDEKLTIDRQMLTKQNKTSLVSLFEELEQIRQRETEILAIISSQVLTKRQQAKLVKRQDDI